MVTLAACGGDGDDSRGATPLDPATTAAVPERVERPAEELVPDIEAMGYRLADEFEPPTLGQRIDTYRKAFVGADGGDRVALIDVSVFEELELARRAYQQTAEAWRNPPPGVISGASRFVETASPPVADERRSYVTESADAAGYRAWTDIYRLANVIVVIQVVDDGGSDQLALRESLISAVMERARE